MRLLQYIKFPWRFVLSLNNNGFGKVIPDRIFLKCSFLERMSYKLDLKNPQTFNEKLQWLKLYNRNPIYTTMVDKYTVKQYVAKIIGDEYIIPTIGVWDKFDDIDFASLPSQFVLKCTHDSGGIVICTDKNKLNIQQTKEKINRSLATNYYLLGREWPYKNVKPKIIAEKYMIDESGYELKDYKFMCFDGRVECVFTCTERFSDSGIKVTFFDCNWERLPFIRHYPASNKTISKPKQFNKMIELAKKLSEGIPFVRIDLYEIDNQIYFGEITLYPGNGMEKFTPHEWDYRLGSLIKLPKK